MSVYIMYVEIDHLQKVKEHFLSHMAEHVVWLYCDYCVNPVQFLSKQYTGYNGPKKSTHL